MLRTSISTLACLALGALALSGCYDSPADAEGRACNAHELCPLSYQCLEGGCVYLPGGQSASGSGSTSQGATTAGTSAMGTHGSSSTTSSVGHTTISTGTVGVSNSTGTTGTGFSGTQSTGTTGVFTGTTGVFNTGTLGTSGSGTTGATTFGTSGTIGTHGSASGTTGGFLSVCQSCLQSSECISGYCNLVNGDTGYCDLTQCDFNPMGCAPFACSPSGVGCACETSNTGTSGSVGTTFGTSGTSGTTGGVLPICAQCEQSSQCLSGVCNTTNSFPGFCDTEVDCNADPLVCSPFGCNVTGNCLCSVISTTGPSTTGFSSTSGFSSGTTGFSTSGSSGTTGGFCSGPGLQDNTDCGGANQVCASGQTCTEYTTIFGISYLACGCTSSFGNNGVDSCRAANDVPGGNGLVVCDAVTLSCRAPQDMEGVFANASSPGAECAAGYGIHEPLATLGGSVDGGAVCAQPCNLNSDCSANFTTCVPGSPLLFFPDGGDQFAQFNGYCDYNFCGPDIEPASGVAYYGACNSAGTDDGTCEPFGTSVDDSYYGICMRNGPNPTAGACGGLLGAASASCIGGDVCIPTNQPVDPCNAQQTSYCLPACNANSPNSGPVTPTCPGFIGTQTTCQAYSSDPSGNALQAGVCF